MVAAKQRGLLCSLTYRLSPLLQLGSGGSLFIIPFLFIYLFFSLSTFKICCL